MELRHLRYFVAVADEGTIARAAARLGIAHSPLARRVHDLEQELGVTLFERLPRGLRLTAAGACFLADARRVLADASAAVERVRAAGGAVAGPLRVGHAEFGVAGAIVREATLAFGREHPQVGLSVHAAGLMRQEGEVRAGRLDIGFSFDIDPDDPTLASEVLWEDHLTGAVLSAAHPLAERDVLTLDELAELAFVVVPRRLATRVHDGLLEHLRTLGLASELRQDIDNANSLFAVISAGTAWAAASESLGDHLPPEMAYRRVKGLSFLVVNRTFWRRGGETPALLAFVGALGRIRHERLAAERRD